MSTQTPVKTLGILGGGQLGRMSAQAAAKIGIDVVIFTPEENSPASQVSRETIVAAYDDKTALERFAAKVDVITYEFENIPVETVRFLQKLKPVYPDGRLLEIAQDRISEKTYLNSIGIPTARFAAATTVGDIASILKLWNNSDLIIKTRRFGYDGKGQVRIAATAAEADIRNAFDQLKSDSLIIEEVVPFAYEISVIVARDASGGMAVYGPQLNKHKNHILHKTIVPAPMEADLAAEAVRFTEKLAAAVSLRGVLGLEMFVTADKKILANEIAPRTHNSGHWSIDACRVSQFENHVRAVCGLPVENPGRFADAEMVNLIGDDIHDLGAYETRKAAHIHLYGKAEPRPGRKMGHVTLLAGDLSS
jgi:5-(carboxyamino)imidazole ribonucleotide synthase